MHWSQRTCAEPLTLATLARGRARLIAGTAGLLTLASFLTTRLGNVPING